MIVGEVLGPEVMEMLSAMSQGNNGSLSTIHARSADDVFAQLAPTRRSTRRLDFAVAHSLIAARSTSWCSSSKNPLLGGRRCVTEVRGGRRRRRTAGWPAAMIFVPVRRWTAGRSAPRFRAESDGTEELQAAGYDDTAGCVRLRWSVM